MRAAKQHQEVTNVIFDALNQPSVFFLDVTALSSIIDWTGKKKSQSYIKGT